MNYLNTVQFGDCRESMLKMIADGFKAQMCVTSPPYYGLRSYLDKNHSDKALEIGSEKTPEQFISNLVGVFSLVKDLLHDDGVIWVNIGDSYAGSGKGRNSDGTHQEGGKQGTSRGTIEGHLWKTETPNCKPKDLIGIPWMLAFALRADGWYLRQDIIWSKPNPMPESVTDRCTKAHEYVFLLSKQPKYFYNHEAVKEPCSESNVNDFLKRKTLNNKGKGAGTYDETRPDLCRSRSDYMPDDFMRNKRSVWSVATKPYPGSHFAVFPEDLITPCILAGSREGDTVFDPFFGSGTTGAVALKYGRNYVGCDLNKAYEPLQKERLKVQVEMVG